MIAVRQSNKNAFLDWAVSVFSRKRCKWIERNILRMEQFAVATKLISGSIFEVADLATLDVIYRSASKNIFFQKRNRKLIKDINKDFKAYMKFCSLKTGIKKNASDSEFQKLWNHVEPTNVKQQEDGLLVVDFNSRESLAFTKPKCILFSGFELDKPSTWKDVYVTAVSVLYEKNVDFFRTLRSLPGYTRLEFGTISDASCMIAPREIAKELCVETNFSATDFVRRIETLFTMVGEDVSNFKIFYEKKANKKSESSEATKKRTSSACETAFRAYLRNTVQLANRTCFSYVSSIRSAERYAEDNGFEFSNLFSEDRVTTLATATELYEDSVFMGYNEQQHYRFSAAINKLLEFIGADRPECAVVSLETNSGRNFMPTRINSGIVSVLKSYFVYGFKYESIRELMRFRQFADSMDVELPEDDEELKASILNSGIIIENKVFYKNDDMLQELRSMIDGIFSSGVHVVYFESLFEIEQDWMDSHVITSSGMLKEYLQKTLTKYSFSKQFFVKGSRRTEKEAVTDELKRVWGANQSEKVFDLHKRLPYIPLVNIRRVISGNDLFVTISEGEYLFIDRFRISKAEEEDILDFVEDTCNENGFTSLSDVPLGSIEEENYELTRAAIYDAIYKKVLSSKYHRKNAILTKEKSELDVITLLKQYIKDKDECTFDEVVDKVEELTGVRNRLYAFHALYDDMVRVDRNRFVANRFVNFNVEEIDTVLSGFVTESFRAILDVTTFALFPVCGQSWNHYLLESFCYKYSRKFSLHVINFNNKNAGIIAMKDYNNSYNEMVAIALAKTDIELSLDTVGDYLFSTGYITKRKYTKLGEIAQRASEIRKERR